MSKVLHFVIQLRQYVRYQDGDAIALWLQFSPDAPIEYHQMSKELKERYPKSKHQALEKLIDDEMPFQDDLPEGQASTWAGLLAFMKDYLSCWRDVDFGDLMGAHQLLSLLVNSCATAFGHPQYGAMLLKTSMTLSETLARLTMTLNRRPDLTRKMRTGDEDNRKSIAESSAEIIQKIFTVCLTDRSSARNSMPEGKKIGVYMFANLVLKLLFACRKTHLAKMIFTNIASISPPLLLYPAAQRVTFLYYLGRFYFSEAQYLRAANCLQGAYLQTPRQLTSHRTNILTFLIPCNLLLGRFPSQTLLSRPESQTLAPMFVPLCQAIRSGNFIQFQTHLATHEDWLFDKGLLIPLTHRLRPLLWRALARKTFLLTYIPPEDSTSRKAATLDIRDLHTVTIFIQRRLEGWLPSNPLTTHRPSVSKVRMQALKNSVYDTENTTLSPPPSGPRKLRPNEGLVWGNKEVEFEDVEMMVATLVQQGLMHGFVAHGQARFAIIGARGKGPVPAGFPVVWQAILGRMDQDGSVDEVPGWVKE